MMIQREARMAVYEAESRAESFKVIITINYLFKHIFAFFIDKHISFRRQKNNTNHGS